jgi:hypothetical protein
LSGLVLSANVRLSSFSERFPFLTFFWHWQSKLVALKSFYRFLQHSIPRNGDETGSTNAESSSRIPTWYFSSSFATSTAYHIFAQLLRPSRTQSTTSGTLPIAGRTMVWQDNVDVDEDALEREDFSGSFALADISGQGLAGWSFGELESAADSRDYVPGASDRQARSSIAVGFWFRHCALWARNPDRCWFVGFDLENSFCSGVDILGRCPISFFA